MLGGEAGVLLGSASETSLNIEAAKLELRATVLCFKGAETVADSAFVAQHAEMQFSVVAYDTLDGRFVGGG